MPGGPLIFLCPRVPHPLNTGAKIRTGALLRALMRDHEVHYLGFLQPDLSAEEARAALAGCASVHLVPEPATTTAGKGWLALRSLADARPATMIKYWSPTIAGRLRELLVRMPEAIVHADHLHMAAYLAVGSAALCVVDEHNVETQIVERTAERFTPEGAATRLAAPVIRRWLASQAARMRRHEAAWLARADLALAVSPGDAEMLSAMAPSTPVEVIANGVDTEYFRPAPEGTHVLPRRMVFTGSMNWLPNQDAMLWFCREIRPLLQGGAEGGWSLDIVGQSPPASVRELADESVRLTGMVDDVRPYVHGAGVFIVPLRIGGGSRLKILEAFAMGIPVVSTTVGCEGLGVEDGRELLVADTPRDFARAIDRVTTDGALRRALVERATEHVRRHFTWEAIGRRLTTIYAERRGAGASRSVKEPMADRPAAT